MATKEKKKLLVFGYNLRVYPRNRVLLEVLEEKFVLEEVKALEGFLGQIQFIRTLIARIPDVDGILLLQPTMRFAPIAWLARRLFTQKFFIGDAFISIYDTYVSDRELARGKSLKGLYYHLLDLIYVRAVDVLIFDTPEHEAYFARTCRIPARVKRFVFPISVNTAMIDRVTAAYPEGLPPAPDKKTVLFLGGYIPLQGIEHILDAAKHLTGRNDIRFVLIGNGQTRKKMTKKAEDLELKNVIFIERLPNEAVMAALKTADVALGIFGHSEKAQRVIPNKILENMAAMVPTVTGRNVPTERYFKDGEHIYYARLADGKDIARAIELVLSEPEKARQITENARRVIDECFSTASLQAHVEVLRSWLDGVRKEESIVARPRIVVYTAIFGPKDRLREPLVRLENVDFICFTDQLLYSNTWEIRRIAPPVPGDLTRSNRHVKFFPNIYLSDYEYSIYVDGNMRLLADPTPLVDMYLHDANIAFFDHMGNVGDARDSLYAEANELIARDARGKGKDDPELIQSQVGAYRKDGYPDHDGLITGMVILRRHHNSDVIRAMEAWWKELTTWSRRDQISFNYVAWREKLRYGIIPGDSRNNPYFYRHGHSRKGFIDALRARINEELFASGLC